LIFLSYSGLVIAVTSLFSSVFVFFNNPRKQTNITWGLFGLSVTFWGIGLFFGFKTDNRDAALFWGRFLNLAAILIPLFFVHFVYSFLEKVKQNIIFIISSYVIIVSYFCFSFYLPHLFIKNVIKQPGFLFYPTAGPLYYFFVIIFSVYVSTGIAQLWEDYKTSSGLKRVQIRYLFWGIAIGFAGGATTFPMVFGMPIYPFGTWLVTLYVILTTYAITKHHLLDIEIVIKKGLVYSGATALLTGAFVSLILVSNQIFKGLTGYSSIWPSIIGAFVIALLFQPLRENLQKIVDKIFFRTRYDYQRILSRYSHALAQPMTDLNRFARIAPYLLVKAMGLAAASVMVLDREKHSYIVRAGEREAGDLIGLELAEDSPLIVEIYARKKEISLDEIKYVLKTNKDLVNVERQRLEEVVSQMQKLKSVLLIPSISESEYFKKPTLLSVINLGKKKSDENFSWEDVEFLHTLANRAGISIEYAFIFEELKKNQAAVLRSEKLAAIGTTTAGVAHELKNPLTYLSILSQLLTEKWDDPEFKKSVTDTLPAETKRMQMIVEGLLDYSREKELQVKPVEIKEVVDKTLALLAYEIRKQRIEVKTNFNHEGMVAGDPNRLMQVFMNIMANAVQAMGAAGGQLIISTDIYNNNVRVSIQDTGPGIPQESLKKIFDPFYSTKDGGTGLGLVITKKIIEEHKGSIDVESAPGKGTTFQISLPRA